MIKITGLYVVAEPASDCRPMSNQGVLVKVGSRVLVASKATPKAKFRIEFATAQGCHIHFCH